MSSAFRNAPAGFIYPGDPGFPPGTSGLNKKWTNISPRAGVAWDVRGDGRLAIRSSYALMYDYPGGEYFNNLAAAPPYGNRTLISDPAGLFDDPYRDVGGNPHPIEVGPNTVYPAGGTLSSMDPDINAPRVQSWNVSVEQQIGDELGSIGQLSRQLLRPPLGARRAQSGRLPGARSLHDPGRGVSRLHDERAI